MQIRCSYVTPHLSRNSVGFFKNRSKVFDRFLERRFVGGSLGITMGFVPLIRIGLILWLTPLLGLAPMPLNGPLPNLLALKVLGKAAGFGGWEKIN